MLKPLNKGISTSLAIGIIVVLAILVGGILVWRYGLLEKEEISPPKFPAKIELVTITLDKTEYSRGENISTQAIFAGKIHVFSDGAWSIYRWDNNSWNKIAESIGCSSYPNCEGINFDKIEDCRFPICEAPAWYEIDSSHPYAQWTWGQKEAGGNKLYKCKFQLGVVDQPQIIDHECIVYKQVPAGKYKIRFEYVMSSEQLFGGKEGKNVKYTEREFTIK